MRVLITGGTGSLGSALVAHWMPDPEVSRIVVYSRDEVKQGVLAARTRDPENKLRFFLGDVRDADRLRDVMATVDTVIHTAALKRVDQVSYNPDEVLKTNILGTWNVLRVAREVRCRRVLMISSDKAVQPINVYGASKLMGEFLTIRSNVLSVPRGTLASVLRYGNVWDSRGSVVEVFRRQVAHKQPLTVTDPCMTRFFVTLAHAVTLVDRALQWMVGGEVFVPKLRAWSLDQVARFFQPEYTEWTFTGLRAGGEKLHESLMAERETERLVERGPFYVILPECHEWTDTYAWDQEPRVALTRYTSDSVPRVEDLSTLL